MSNREVGDGGGVVGWGAFYVHKQSYQNIPAKIQGENSNSKTLFSKDCSLGSFRPV